MSTRRDRAAELLDELDELVLDLDLAGDLPRARYANGAARRLLGAEGVPDARLAEALLRIVHADDRALVDDQMTLVAAGIERTCECRIIRADGAVRWLRLTMRPYVREAASATWIAVDVTDERNLAERLFATSDLALGAIHGLADASSVDEVLPGNRLRVIRASGFLRALAGGVAPLGADLRDLVGPVVHPADRELFDRFAALVASGRAATVRHRVQLPDRPATTIASTSIPRRLAGGRVIAVGMTIEIVTGVNGFAPARRLIVEADGGDADGPAPGSDRLTRRQGEILALLCDGMNAHQIARRLMLSDRTVGNHINAILHRLGVHSRSEAIAMAYRLGLI